MRLIKRYPNRKLYDTEAKQYITLEGIAEMIRQGAEISVIDHASGEDLTTLILTQIIVEHEKKQSGVMPRSVLSGLIQSGGERLAAIQRALTSPLSSLQQFEEELVRRVEELVRRGEMTEREARNLIDKVLSQFPLSGRTQTAVETDIEEALGRLKIPQQDDLERLKGQIEELAKKIDELSQ